MNITDPIRQIAAAQPETVALLRANGDTVSFAALDRQIDRCARRARRLGLQPGQIVGMTISLIDEGFGLIVALGLARAGIVTASIGLPARHLAAVLLHPGESIARDVRRIPLDWAWLADDDATPFASEVGGEALFRIFGTSGTTGASRYCPVSHATMAARVAATRYPIAGVPWHTILICGLALDGNWGMRTALGTLSSGGTLMVGGRDTPNLATAVLRHNVTTLVTSPIGLQTFLASVPRGIGPLPSLRAAVVGGSQLPGKLWQEARRRLCPNIITSFGASETSVVAMARYEELAAVPLGVGRLVPDVAVQAVDDAHQPLPAGSQGVLRFRTQGDISGYFDDAEATRATFRDGWFYSGDIGAVTPDGMLVIAGRTGEFINSGGVKVSPRLIEDVLLTLPGVTQAAAFAVPDDDGLAQIWAAVVADAPVDGAVAGAHCWQRLGPAGPKAFLQMPALPRNANGKVITQRLVDFALEQRRRAATPAS